MRKFILFFIAVILLISCKPKNGSPTKNTSQFLSKWDSIIKESIELPEKDRKLINIDPSHFDTTNISTSPIQIISKEIIKEKDYLGIDESFIIIRYKNNSSKVISGVKIRWFCEDGFGEPVLMSSFAGRVEMSIGEERNDEKLKPNEIGVIKLEQLVSSGYKIVSAWAYEVAYEDGKLWNVK